ncbi:phosphoribosylaminoimidazolesuccinocarboxamide synthase [Candidatus Gottesmanbacteria bacterium RIFCSPHIGHO2_02_FULL_40_13]|uniref:Phosphoribosylaminoimidazole-succinocarboxamide synthase n=1 Tax=Candidatus Gottesmanbacteria bacterium RIFCSPHIGHO2_02_FULL_40_13 TaxID=1798384 RepID=A0A1F6A903_9BACT|nr:MAG: phosphoribosylaminoimidazolesuccinocarboxamide synthase [Candidatus Gottesmanbacteria bacterium RIFCSPHIGHO2_02_FULL_40_13]
MFKTIDLPSQGPKQQGKVRDIYNLQGKRILITTDRISAFDRVLGYIPYKGQVLNQLSAFWFEKTSDIVANHLISVPHPNVSLVHEAKPYPVEMVVRGYISGVTNTSIWGSYEKGERMIYGIKFPEGLHKNQKLPYPVVTPTTKAEHGGHDQPLTEKEILDKKLLSKKVWEDMKEASIKLYLKGTEICRRRGLILVDTKYEFGEYKGKMMLIDEIHTPDSSRYWKKENYQKRFEKGLEPENFDKEFFRIWYVKRGYKGDGKPPKMNTDLQLKTAMRYIKIYEMITGKTFKGLEYPLEELITESLSKIY